MSEAARPGKLRVRSGLGFVQFLRPALYALLDTVWPGTGAECAAGRVALYWRAGAEANWSPDRKVEAPVPAGRNTVFLVVPAQRLALEGLVLRLLDHPGTSRLRSLAVRAVDQAAGMPASH